jgi:hypothetical protein
MSPATAALIRERRFAVAGTYTLTAGENLCMLAYPTLTGRAVDELLQRRHEGLDHPGAWTGDRKGTVRHPSC